MLLCLHEEAAVAIAHGYAKVTGKAMAAAVHSNVGLFHATMAIFNAWCDRMPMLILGATGPVDAMKRRPWIDWIHTAADQGAIIRNFTKWDDQPASAGRGPRVGAARLLDVEHRAVRPDLHQSRRRGAGGQARRAAAADRRQALHAAGGAAVRPPSWSRRRPTCCSAPRSPLILAGRVSRKEDDWNRRVQLAEALDARVTTNLKIGAAFPTDHPLHIGFAGDLRDRRRDRGDEGRRRHPQSRLGRSRRHVQGGAARRRPATIIQVSLDQNLHNGWSMDYEGLPPVDLFIPAETDATVAALLARDRQPTPSRRSRALVKEQRREGQARAGRARWRRPTWPTCCAAWSATARSA